MPIHLIESSHAMCECFSCFKSNFSFTQHSNVTEFFLFIFHTNKYSLVQCLRYSLTEGKIDCIYHSSYNYKFFNFPFFIYFFVSSYFDFSFFHSETLTSNLHSSENMKKNLSPLHDGIENNIMEIYYLRKKLIMYS